MGKIYEIYALESLQEMEAEEMPYDIWLPYVRMESERYICKESNEVWHRFEGVTVYMEDEDYPEGDLIEETEKVFDGLVCWQGVNGTVPEFGDVFRVLDQENQVVFEETISGASRLYGRYYASAVKAGDFTREILNQIEIDLKYGLGDTFTNNLCVYVDLKALSSSQVKTGEEKVDFSARGIDFHVFVEEHTAEKAGTVKFLGCVDGKFIHNDVEMKSGDKWYEVSYNSVAGRNAGSAGMVVGWGIGSASEAVVQVREILDNSLEQNSLDARLVRAAEAQTDQTRRSENIIDIEM